MIKNKILNIKKKFLDTKNKILLIIENILYTTIFFFFKSNNIKKRLFTLYLAKTNISEDSINENKNVWFTPKVYKYDYHAQKKYDPNFTIEIDDGTARQLEILKSTPSLQIIPTPAPKWKYPIKYPLKLHKKNVHYFKVPEAEKSVYLSKFNSNYSPFPIDRTLYNKPKRRELVKVNGKLEFMPTDKLNKILNRPKIKKKLVKEKFELIAKNQKDTIDKLDLLSADKILNKPKRKKLVNGKFDVLISKKLKAEYPEPIPNKVRMLRKKRDATTWTDWLLQRKRTWEEDGVCYLTWPRSYYWKSTKIYDTLFPRYHKKPENLKLSYAYEKRYKWENRKLPELKNHWVQSYIDRKKIKKLPDGKLHDCELDIQTVYDTKFRVELGNIIGNKLNLAYRKRKSLMWDRRKHELLTCPEGEKKNRLKLLQYRTRNSNLLPEPPRPKGHQKSGSKDWLFKPEKYDIIKLKTEHPEWAHVKYRSGKPISSKKLAQLKGSPEKWFEVKVPKWKWAEDTIPKWKWVSDHLPPLLKLYRKKRQNHSIIKELDIEKIKERKQFLLKRKDRLMQEHITAKNRIARAKGKYLEKRTNDAKSNDKTTLISTNTNKEDIIINNTLSKTPKSSTITPVLSKPPSTIYTTNGPRNRLVMLNKIPAQGTHYIDIRTIFKHKDISTKKPRKIRVFRHDVDPAETNFHYYDLNEKETTLFNFKTDGALGWWQLWSDATLFFEQYGYAGIMAAMFLFVHWTLAEAILSKFKCQQHYKLNTALFNAGFLFFIYLFFNFTLSGKGFSFHGYGVWLESNYWPIYFLLYVWWFFLMASFIVTVIFMTFTPKTPYLRGKKILKQGDLFFNFIPSLICLLLPPIIAPRGIPAWIQVESILLFNSDKVQFHFGYTYLFFVWIIIGLTSVAFFYYIVTLDSYIKYKGSKDMKYIDAIISLLFTESEDDNDIWAEVGGDKGIPFYLNEYLEDFLSNREDYRVPDGFHYHSISYLKFLNIWQGSYSRNIFLVWYFTMALYYTIIYQMYSFCYLSTLIVFVTFVWILLTGLYLAFIKFFLGFNIIRKKRHKILFCIFIFFFLFILTFFYKDFLFFFGW